MNSPKHIKTEKEKEVFEKENERARQLMEIFKDGPAPEYQGNLNVSKGKKTKKNNQKE